jgi:hypothetical protein
LDNDRFAIDVEKWLGRPIVTLKADKYSDHFQVIEKERYINGPGGAKCTVELKKRVRLKFQEVDDVQYLGYTLEEQDRAERFCKSFPEVSARFPLIERGLTKADCVGLIERNGIELPAMYRLGYNNNNCIGCVKGGAGYWNKIRLDFPEAFQRMAKLERLLGRSCINGRFLDELDTNVGTHKDLAIGCDFVYQAFDPQLGNELKAGEEHGPQNS